MPLGTGRSAGPLSAQKCHRSCGDYPLVCSESHRVLQCCSIWRTNRYNAAIIQCSSISRAREGMSYSFQTGIREELSDIFEATVSYLVIIHGKLVQNCESRQNCKVNPEMPELLLNMMTIIQSDDFYPTFINRDLVLELFLILALIDRAAITSFSIDNVSVKQTRLSESRQIFIDHKFRE